MNKIATGLPNKGPSPYPNMSDMDITIQGIVKLLNGLNTHS